MNTNRITKTRLQALRCWMQKNNITVYLVFTSDAHQSEYIDLHFKFREYLSGFTGSAGALLVTQKYALLWTDGRYFVQAQKELEGTEIVLYRMQIKGVPSMMEYLSEHVDVNTCIGCDGRTISASFYADLQQLAKEKGATLCIDKDAAKEVWVERPSVSHNMVYLLEQKVAGVSCADKLLKVRRYMEMQKADAYLLTELSSIMWLFNIRGSDIPFNPVAFSYAYIMREHVYLFLQKNCYTQNMLEKLQKDGITILEYGSFWNTMKKINGKRILYDPDIVNSNIACCLQIDNEILPIKNTMLIDKAVKNETEIKYAKKYHVYDAVAMVRFIRYIKDAVKHTEITEFEAACYLDKLRSKTEGFTQISFETISAYAENAAVVHYSAKQEDCAVLQPRGFFLVDSGGQYIGATTDITRTISLGALSYEEKEHYTAVLKGMLRLSDAVFMEGCTGENLDILARTPIWKLGLDYRHGTGHGIGSFLNVHEGPQAFRYKINEKQLQPQLQPGMITSDEPGIYIAGSHGIRLENELLCIKKEENEWGTFLGFETLTLVPFDLDAILPEQMNADEKKILNVYHRTVYESLCPHLTDIEKSWLFEQTHEI